MSRREFTESHGEGRYVRREENGRFVEKTDAGKSSLKTDAVQVSMKSGAGKSHEVRGHYAMPNGEKIVTVRRDILDRALSRIK
jgi:hypothetical protein